MPIIYIIYCREYQTLDFHIKHSLWDPVTVYHFLLNGENALNDALFIQPSFEVDIHHQQSKEFVLRTKRFSKESTKSRRCQEHWPKACHEILLRKKAKLEYNCTVPILYSGIDLDDEVSNSYQSQSIITNIRLSMNEKIFEF